MATFVKIRQDRQIRSSLAYADDKPAGSALENEDSLQGDLDSLRSQVNRIIDKSGNGKWYNEPPADLATVEFVAVVGARTHDQNFIEAVDNVRTVFTVIEKFRHDGVSDEHVFYNGMKLLEGAGNDYIASESVATEGYDTITFFFAPRLGDELAIDYTRI